MGRNLLPSVRSVGRLKSRKMRAHPWTFIGVRWRARLAFGPPSGTCNAEHAMAHGEPVTLPATGQLCADGESASGAQLRHSRARGAAWSFVGDRSRRLDRTPPVAILARRGERSASPHRGQHAWHWLTHNVRVALATSGDIQPIGARRSGRRPGADPANSAWRWSRRAIAPERSTASRWKPPIVPSTANFWFPTRASAAILESRAHPGRGSGDLRRRSLQSLRRPRRHRPRLRRYWPRRRPNIHPDRHHERRHMGITIVASPDQSDQRVNVSTGRWTIWSTAPRSR